MIARKNEQGSFYGMLWETLLPADHELLRILKSFDFGWVEEALESYYKAGGPGRPAVSPRKLFLMLFLEMYDNLSDYEVSERVKRDVLYRRFAGFELEEEIPDHSTLSVFRERIGEEGFRKVFNRFVEELEKKKLISHRLKIVDATHVEADAMMRGRLGMVLQGQRRVLSAMKAEDASKAEALELRRKMEEPRLNEKDPKVLAREVLRLKDLLETAKTHFKKQGKETAELVEELLYRTPEPLDSLTDPEARPGHKSPTKKFYGYKVNTVTNESEIVTTVETIPGNEHEGKHLPRLLKEEAERGLKGDLALADALYDSGLNRQTIREDEDLRMQEIIPEDHRSVQAEHFKYDETTNTLFCPQGKAAVGTSPHPAGQFFYFSQKDCRFCPTQNSCPSFSHREHRARLLLSLDRKMRLSSPLAPPLQKTLFKFRTTVERIYGKAKHWHGFARARYRGRSRVAVQAFLTFFMLNAKKALRIHEGLVPLKPPGLAALGYG